MSQLSTSKLELAAQFVNSTASHIFLTGKAGTGKTTFLHNLAKATHKTYAVVAPTGIAALNAKGVTIHSQFLLPFGTYLVEPVNFRSNPGGNFYSRRELASRHTLNSARKQVLRSIDLLIIDEVSMLRADVMDAMDYRLRSARGNFNRPFGGVQLLMIGDLHQLPPIVKDNEWNYLKEFYASPHFYNSQALQKSGFTYIELDTIFRQQDPEFISLLNALRDNRCTTEDLNKLNSFYTKEDTHKEGVITLCTHNYQADAINRMALEKLNGPSSFYKAELEGDFPVNLYPVEESLELRVGSQIMFIKNDSEDKAFFNGKIAKVTELTEDGICVSMDDNEVYWLNHHKWENKRYTINPVNKEMEEEVLGSFYQYPVKLAWAITVHKSQGLTFDNAVIDVGRAFAPGQVYVALSRLRSLAGLRLRTKISDRVISCDKAVVEFSRSRINSDLQQQLSAERRNYLIQLFEECFNFNTIAGQIEYLQKKKGAKAEFEDEGLEKALLSLHQALMAEEAYCKTFVRQLQNLLIKGENDKLQERIKKGSEYFSAILCAQHEILLQQLALVQSLSRTKTFANALEEADQLLTVQEKAIDKVYHISNALLTNKEIGNMSYLDEKQRKRREELLKSTEQYKNENASKFKNKSGRKRKKKQKGETYKISFVLLKEGMSIEEVAAQRALAVSTIEGHLARGIADGILNIDKYVSQLELQEMQNALNASGDKTITDIYNQLEKKFTYAQLRMVKAHLDRKKLESVS